MHESTQHQDLWLLKAWDDTQAETSCNSRRKSSPGATAGRGPLVLVTPTEKDGGHHHLVWVSCVAFFCILSLLSWWRTLRRQKLNPHGNTSAAVGNNHQKAVISLEADSLEKILIFLEANLLEKTLISLEADSLEKTLISLEADSLEKTLMLGKTKGRRRKGNREWDGWMASPSQWTWVWASSGRWWGTRKPGVLHPWGRKESDTTEWLNNNPWKSHWSPRRSSPHWSPFADATKVHTCAYMWQSWDPEYGKCQ